MLKAYASFYYGICKIFTSRSVVVLSLKLSACADWRVVGYWLPIWMYTPAFNLKVPKYHAACAKYMIKLEGQALTPNCRLHGWVSIVIFCSFKHFERVALRHTAGSDHLASQTLERLTRIIIISNFKTAHHLAYKTRNTTLWVTLVHLVGVCQYNSLVIASALRTDKIASRHRALPYIFIMQMKSVDINTEIRKRHIQCVATTIRTNLLVHSSVEARPE